MCAAIAALVMLPASLAAGAQSELTFVEGRVLCLPPAGATTAQVACDDPEASPDDRPRFVLETGDGTHLGFIGSDPKVGLFFDPRVRSRWLRLYGWQREQGFEILNAYSVKDGGYFDLHFKCDVCKITATAPGPCWCCGEDFDFRETAVDTHDLPDALPLMPPERSRAGQPREQP